MRYFLHTAPTVSCPPKDANPCGGLLRYPVRNPDARHTGHKKSGLALRSGFLTWCQNGASATSVAPNASAAAWIPDDCSKTRCVFAVPQRTDTPTASAAIW